MARVIIEGFKTIEEAKDWISAYEGGVEQNMSDWAEEKGFPCMTVMSPYGKGEGYYKIEGEDVKITLK